jgi:hydroxymethylbilane synthase
LRIEPVRGNVDTRLRKLKEGQYHAIVLAAAGLRRLGLESEIAEILKPEQICPAPGQGALAIQTRERDAAYEICRQLNDEASRQAVACERAALARLGGGCQLPVGSFAVIRGESLYLTAVVVSPDGLRHLRTSAEGPRDRPDELGDAVAEDLLSRGASAILSEIE